MLNLGFFYEKTSQNRRQNSYRNTNSLNAFVEGEVTWSGIKLTMDFSCLPTQTEQIREIVSVFYYCHNKNFTEEDVRPMFVKLQVVSLRSGKVIVPTVKKIGTILEKTVT